MECDKAESFVLPETIRKTPGREPEASFLFHFCSRPSLPRGHAVQTLRVHPTSLAPGKTIPSPQRGDPRQPMGTALGACTTPTPLSFGRRSALRSTRSSVAALQSAPAPQSGSIATPTLRSRAGSEAGLRFDSLRTCASLISALPIATAALPVTFAASLPALWHPPPSFRLLASASSPSACPPSPQLRYRHKSMAPLQPSAESTPHANSLGIALGASPHPTQQKRR